MKALNIIDMGDHTGGSRAESCAFFRLDDRHRMAPGAHDLMNCIDAPDTIPEGVMHVNPASHGYPGLQPFQCPNYQFRGLVFCA